jgi:hypothetical protein
VKTNVDLRTVDLSAYPDLVVIYLGMRVRTVPGIKTLLAGVSPLARKSATGNLPRDGFAEDWLVSQGYRFFRECLRSRGKVRHLRGLGGGIRSLFRAELALRRQTVVEDFEPKLREWLNPI